MKVRFGGMAIYKVHMGPSITGIYDSVILGAMEYFTAASFEYGVDGSGPL